MSTVTSATFNPMESAYRYWLSQQFNPTQLFGRAAQATYGPMSEMAYWTGAGLGYDPDTDLGSNPYSQFLNEGTGGYSPMTSAQWQTRAGDVSKALAAGAGILPTTTADYTLEDVQRMQQRFGAVAGSDPAQVAARQAGIVNQAALSGTPLALRGETQAILQRLLDTWMGSAKKGSYLDYAQDPTKGGSVWRAFDL